MLPDFVLFCRVHQMLCSFTSCQTMMGAGAFFQHCHSKTHKHTQHNTEYTPPLDMSELRVFIHKVLNTFYAAVFLVFHVFSLASQYCQTSSWIVFLEEETNVNLHNLLQVLSKFKTRKVSCRLFSLSAVVTAKV